MPDTISVSPTAPEKLVVNGVDLLNREELSVSQNRELQRYIDSHAHLLGFLDKEKQEQESKKREATGNIHINGSGSFGSLDCAKKPFGANQFKNNVGDDDSVSNKLEQSLLNRTGSTTSSDYGSGKRKGVSWSDADSSRARSYSAFKNPNKQANLDAHQPRPYSEQAGSWNNDNKQANLDAHQPRPYSEQAGTWNNDAALSGKKFPSPLPLSEGQNRAGSHEASSPPISWGNVWLGGSRDNLDSRNEGYGYRGFPKQVVPTYSALERSADDYNKYDTHRFREHQDRRSRERDEPIRFHGYGDHRVSGVCEIKPVYWQGGEIVTDPQYFKKSLRPRSIFYSPIGDGVVAADGVELKRLPPDLNPKVSVIHQRLVEPGDPGRTGLKVTEKTWDEGNRDGANDGGLRDSYTPWEDDSRHKNAGAAPSPFGDDGSGDKNAGGAGPDKASKFPVDDGLKNGYPKSPITDHGLGEVPFPDDGGHRGSMSRPESGLSMGDKTPREGWTKTFIVNPRECINIYGTETLTSIFDLEDHTPKTMITVKETFSPSRDIDLEESEKEKL